MTNHKITILSTRPLDEAITATAATQGIDIDTISFIDTAPLLTSDVKEQIKQSLTLRAIVVFTSMNAVEVVAHNLNRHKPAWDIFCIGHTTRELAAHHFGAASIAGTADSALALANTIVDARKGQPVLFFCGDQRRDELPATLQQHHIQVTEMVVYTTVATPVTISKPYDGILFFSPSAVHSFFSVNTLPSHTILFAIGETTAASIQPYTSNTIITGNEPGKNNLAALAIHYLKRE